MHGCAIAERTARYGVTALPLDDVGRLAVVWWGMATNAQKAQEFLDLHHRERPLVLPTAWDVWSAKLIESAGFKALTIGSHPVSDSLGYPDGEGVPFEMLLEATARISAGVEIPVSVDVESGYDREPEALVRGVLDVGAVGVNIEDTVHSTGTRRTPREHADYIGAVRSAADEAGVHLVINGRTDGFIGEASEEERLADVLERLHVMEEAGADSLYPVKVPSRSALDRILEEVSLPVNVTAHPVNGAVPGGIGLSELAQLGVGRVSFGPLLQAALADRAGELMSGWAGENR